MIIIKRDAQIELMRKAGKVTLRAIETVQKYIKPGVTTLELDTIAYEFIKSQGGHPSFLGYKGFPGSINSSINEVIVHGIPSLEKLKDGDIIGIDIGVNLGGYHGDAARTFGVGNISAENQDLIDTAKKCFYAGIAQARHRNHLNLVCTAIEECATKHGYHIAEEFIGHGIGKDLHEEPDIPNFKMDKRGPRLYKGMTLAIEPMINIGTRDGVILNDGWTAITKDKKNSAHYENTILVTDGEPEILTV